MALSDLLGTRVYATGTSPKRVTSKFAKAVARSGVVRSQEFRRIEALPRRVWHTAPDLTDLIKLMTEALRTPEGTETLWPTQVAALRDLADVGGLCAPISVGAGKTYISVLAPHMVDAERPLLITPASLRDQTVRHVLPHMSKHWKIPKLTLLAFEDLSAAKHADILDTLHPDLIVVDEAHCLARPNSARTRRVTRYMREYPNTMFAAMSGTITRRSIKDYWHILLWCLKPDLCPLPAMWREVQDWADALDEGVEPTRIVAPGALKRLCEGKESPREGYQRRLSETPGVISTTDERPPMSLVIRELSLDVPHKILDMIDALITKWELPNGDLITEAIDLWRRAREIATGFWYTWAVPPPVKWLDARKAWKSYVRETLTHNRRGLDTELQVWNECTKAEKPLHEFVEWRAVKDSFKPKTVPVWESDYLVNAVVKWMKEPGIVWTEHDAFGCRFDPIYFGGGRDEIVDLDGTQPIVASIKAHGTGKNLPQWNRNLVVSCSPGGATWEQMLGRTHRHGQKADEVVCEVFLHTPALANAFRQARADARYIEDTTGSNQKLNYATIVEGA